MKVTVLYTKNTRSGMRQMISFGEVLPTLKDIKEHYEVVYYDETEREYPATPEDLFRIFNDADGKVPNPLTTPEGQEKLRSLEVSHTSMSVGDIVQIDEIVSICQPDGWATVRWWGCINGR